MPELPFPDLATPAGRETEPPPFEAIVRRARRRRRNHALAVATGTVAVLALTVTGAVVTLGDQQDSPTPVGPSPTSPAPTATAPSQEPDRTSAADATRITRDGDLVGYAATADSLVTIWQLCGKGSEEGQCRYAWQLQGPSGIHRGLARDSAGAYAAGDSFVLASWSAEGVLLGSDGTTREVQQVAPRSVTAGDALLRVRQEVRKGLTVVDPAAAESWSLPDDQGVGGWGEGALAPDGAVWATTSLPDPTAGVQISWLEPRTSTWQHHTISTSFAEGVAAGPVAVANDHVAALAMHDGVDVATFGTFSVTTDGGVSWSDLRPRDLPFDNADAVAATTGGTLYVASTDARGEDHVFRSTDDTWTHFTEVPGARGADRLVAAGDRVVARRGTTSRTELFTLDDQGHVEPWAVFTN